MELKNIKISLFFIIILSIITNFILSNETNNINTNKSTDEINNQTEQNYQDNLFHYMDNSTKIKKLYNDVNCTELLLDFSINPQNYVKRRFNTTDIMGVSFNMFPIFEEIDEILKQFFQDILINKEPTSSIINISIILKKFGYFSVIFLCFTCLMAVMFCICSIYDYCPLCFQISKTNRPVLGISSLVFTLFFAMNLIIPIINSYSYY